MSVTPPNQEDTPSDYICETLWSGTCLHARRCSTQIVSDPSPVAVQPAQPARVPKLSHYGTAKSPTTSRGKLNAKNDRTFGTLLGYAIVFISGMRYGTMTMFS